MRYEIVFTRSASEDLQNSFDYYEKENAGLGWEFRNEVALCIEKLTNDMVSYRRYVGDIHKIEVAVFPYLIYYKKSEVQKKIIIGAILHERRNPTTVNQLLGL